MKVWVVERCFVHEECTIDSIFSSSEDAYSYAKKLEEELKEDSEYYFTVVTDYKVQ